MNIIEALQAMKDGKKVQYKGGEIFKYENKHIINTKGDYAGLMYHNLEDDSWSIYQEPLLTDREKEYLEYVLRPYKNNIDYIEKKEFDVVKNEEYIGVHFEDDNSWCDDYMSFPTFERGTRYVKMVANKKYTPEELDIKWKK